MTAKLTPHLLDALDNLPLSWGGSALALPTCLTLPYFSFPNLSRVLSLSSQVFTYLLCSLSVQYNPSKLRLPDLSYKNTGNPVKFEGQMNNEYSLGLSMSPAIFGTWHMYMYLLFTWNDIHSLYLVWQPPTPTHKETHKGTKGSQGSQGSSVFFSDTSLVFNQCLFHNTCSVSVCWTNDLTFSQDDP